MFLFRCLDCRRVWTRTIDGGCPDAECGYACEVIDASDLHPSELVPPDSLGSNSNDTNTSDSIVNRSISASPATQYYTDDASEIDPSEKEYKPAQHQEDINHETPTHWKEPDRYDPDQDDEGSNSEAVSDWSRFVQHDKSLDFIASMKELRFSSSQVYTSSPERSTESKNDAYTALNINSLQVPVSSTKASVVVPSTPPPQTSPSSNQIPLRIEQTTLNKEIEVHPEPEDKKRRKRKNKNKNKDKAKETTTTTPPLPTATLPPPTKPKSKQKSNLKANTTKTQTFKVELPLPDFLKPNTTTTPTLTKPFSAAAAPSHADSSWTTIPTKFKARVNGNGDGNVNAPSYLSTIPGGAFGYRHEDIPQGSHIGVEFDNRGAKYLSKRVVPRL